MCGSKDTSRRTAREIGYCVAPIEIENGHAHRQLPLTEQVLSNAILGSHRHYERWCPKGLVFDFRLFRPLYGAHVDMNRS